MPGRPHMKPLVRLALISVALACAASHAGDRAQAQLVARVNGVEISARELRAAGAASMSQAVEKVIDRELLVQKALEAGPPRDPPGAPPTHNTPPQGPGHAHR